MQEAMCDEFQLYVELKITVYVDDMKLHLRV